MSSASTSTESLKAIVDASAEGLRLDQFLARRFGEEHALSRRKIRDLIEAGAVSVAGKATKRLSRVVRRGEGVEMRLGIEKPKATWVLEKSLIIFEDDDLIAINKPAGLPSQATLDRSRPNLFDAVGAFLKSNDSGDGYAGLHHRLDRDTSGVIVLTKSRRANTGLARQFSEHTAQKVYLALSPAPVDALEILNGDAFTITNHLRKSSGHPARMEAVTSGGDLAETQFSVTKKSKATWLIEAQPRTGRMHQIRVHLAGIGLPILGDFLYASREIAQKTPRMMLHASELRIDHPVTGEKLVIRAPLPEDFESRLPLEF